VNAQILNAQPFRVENTLIFTRGYN